MSHEKLIDAVHAFYQALTDLLNGNPHPMFEVWSHGEDVTYMGPVGGILTGWQPIKEIWITQSKTITKGQVIPKDLHFYESDGLGVVIGHEDSAIYKDGKLVKINLRATSVFKMEKNQYKMIAHHTDPF